MYNKNFLNSSSSNAKWAGMALLMVILFGSLGYMLTQEGWGFWQSFYFTLITITTVGYGDYGINEIGQKFTLILLLFGIVTATYAFSQLMQAAVQYQMNWQRRMLKMIESLNHHHIVCGFGRVGSIVCKRLADVSQPFVVIEKDEMLCNRARQTGYLVIQGSVTDDAMLVSAGIAKAKAIVCAVDNDTENIIATLTARELSKDITIISRVDDGTSAHKVKRAGADHVISPSSKGGEDIANLLINPNLTEFLNHSQQSSSEFTLKEIEIIPNATIVGQTIYDYTISEPSLLFVAVKHPDTPMQVRPDNDMIIQANDVVIVAGRTEAIERLETVARTPLLDLVAAGAK